MASPRCLAISSSFVVTDTVLACLLGFIEMLKFGRLTRDILSPSFTLWWYLSPEETICKPVLHDPLH